MFIFFSNFKCYLWLTNWKVLSKLNPCLVSLRKILVDFWIIIEFLYVLFQSFLILWKYLVDDFGVWFIFLFSLTQFRHSSIALYGRCHRFRLMAQLPFSPKVVQIGFLDLVEHFWQGSALKIRIWKWDSKLMSYGPSGSGLAVSSLADPEPAALRVLLQLVLIGRREKPGQVDLAFPSQHLRGNNQKSKSKWSVQGKKHGDQAGSENRRSKTTVHIRTR